MAIWPYIIANARIDEESTVELNPPVLSAIFGEEVGAIERAIDYLCEPDPGSRTTDKKGRRLIKVGTFTYKVVNLEKYRTSSTDDAKRKYWREYRRKERQSKNVQVNANSVQVNVQHADADADADADAIKNNTEGVCETKTVKKFERPRFDELEFHAQKIGLPPVEINRFQNYYESNGWKVGKNPMKSWRSAMQNWKIHYEERKGMAGNGSNGADKVILGKEYERVIQAIKEVKSTYGDHQTMDTQDREKLSKLVTRKKELQTTLGITI